MSAIARVTYLRAWTVMVGAIVVFIAAGAIAIDIFDRVDPFDISDPDSEVERAYDALEDGGGQSPDPEVILLVAPEADPADAEAALAGVDGVATVAGPGVDPILTGSDGSTLVVGYLDPGANRV